MDALATIKTSSGSLVNCSSSSPATTFKHTSTPFSLPYSNTPIGTSISSSQHTTVTLIKPSIGSATVIAPLDAANDGLHGCLGSSIESSVDGHDVVNAKHDAYDVKHDD